MGRPIPVVSEHAFILPFKRKEVEVPKDYFGLVPCAEGEHDGYAVFSWDQVGQTWQFDNRFEPDDRVMAEAYADGINMIKKGEWVDDDGR